MTCARCRLREATDWRTGLCAPCLTEVWRATQPIVSPWARNAQAGTLPAKETTR
jgi:hypothetical protein